ncbi:hypothetical protein B0H14DRAFT_2638141 [Mycena olivaceomarginata]|nr:hypothetical protein B0H14DRAFT_2638141 [Mycena olivaceomarginata]
MQLLCLDSVVCPQIFHTLSVAPRFGDNAKSPFDQEQAGRCNLLDLTPKSPPSESYVASVCSSIFSCAMRYIFEFNQSPTPPPTRCPAAPVNSSFEYVQSDLARRMHSVAIWNRPSIIDTFSMIAGNLREKGKVIPVMVRGFGYSARRRIHTETGTRFLDSPSGGHQLPRDYPSPTFQLQVGAAYPSRVNNSPELIFLLPWSTLRSHISRFGELMSILSLPFSGANCVTRLMY